MKAITLVRTRDGCAILESQDRYNVLLHGQSIGQLYFNMRGYSGCLPLPNGRKLAVDDQSISSINREVAQINRDFIDCQKGERA